MEDANANAIQLRATTLPRRREANAVCFIEFATFDVADVTGFAPTPVRVSCQRAPQMLPAKPKSLSIELSQDERGTRKANLEDEANEFQLDSGV